eukprot:scaffold53331_cov68-Phaeocystis_antarctica.AAC.6
MERPPWLETSGLEHGDVSKMKLPSAEGRLLKRAPSCLEPSGVGHSMESAVPLALMPLRERDSAGSLYAPPPCAERSPGYTPPPCAESLLHEASRGRARPRSRILTAAPHREPASRQPAPSGSARWNMTFSGLRSRCIVNCACRYETASSSCRVMPLASDSLSAPRPSSTHCSVGPLQSSITRCTTPLVSMKASSRAVIPLMWESLDMRPTSRSRSFSSCTESTPELSSAGTSTTLSAATLAELLLSHTRHTVPKPPLPIGSPRRVQRAWMHRVTALTHGIERCPARRNHLSVCLAVDRRPVAQTQSALQARLGCGAQNHGRWLIAARMGSLHRRGVGYRRLRHVVTKGQLDCGGNIEGTHAGIQTGRDRTGPPPATLNALPF